MNLNRAELSLVFVNDKRMKHLNNLHRGVNRTTDVISFPQFNSLKEIPQNREYLLGDIVINLQQVGSQSLEYRIPINEEVLRILIHGLLHLTGFNHEKNRYQAEKMEKKEIEILDAIKKMD